MMLSPAMFRHPTLSKPSESLAVKFAIEKLTINFARSLVNRVNDNQLTNKTVREALGQLDVGFRNALKNNLIRIHGAEHYVETKRDLTDEFYNLVSLFANDATTKALAEINDIFENLWVFECKFDAETQACFLIKDIDERLTNIWFETHKEFNVTHIDVFRNACVA